MMLHLFKRVVVRLLIALAVVPSLACNSIMNGWLSPRELGSFSNESTLDIRGSLSIQDTPWRVPGTTDPLPDDLTVPMDEYRGVSGDVIECFIKDLRTRGADLQHQAVIDVNGKVDLPFVGWVDVVGLTAGEMEQRLVKILADRGVLHNAEVLARFVVQRGMTYTIFGNELLALRSNRGPGVFPIPRPDFRLIDAIAVSGGLSDLVSDIYIFRAPPTNAAASPPEQPSHPPPGANPSPPPAAERQPERPAIDDPAFLEPKPAPVEPPADAGMPPPDGSTAAGGEPVADELRRIIELIDAEPPAEQAPTDNRTDPSIPPGNGAALDDSTKTGTRWVWDESRREFIEIQSGPRIAAPAPALPPQGDEVKPAVDWQQLARTEFDTRTIRIAAEGLRQGDPRNNIVVRPGDIIRLFSGDIGFYYVLGHVLNPGTFAFRSGASVTLKNAIAASGGLDALAWPDRVTVYRRIGEREQMIQVNLDRIFAGVDPDFFLKRDDIVNVGTHPVAPFLQAVRNLTIPQLNSGMSFLYQWTRTETFFKNEDFGATPQRSLTP
ncbi:MAG: hypothetical protein HOP29_16580 [Phycisphaerales bacterium]|nr:hypothetical protein [Phycisphaerales bacterium]